MMARNSIMASVLMKIVVPMMLNIAASSGVPTLKCDVVPRADCAMMQMISITIAAATVQRTMPLARGLFSVSGMNQATVQRKIVIDVRNFMGLIHGLMPRISR